VKIINKCSKTNLPLKLFGETPILILRQVVYYFSQGWCCWYW